MKKALYIVIVLFLTMLVMACVITVAWRDSPKCSISSLVLDEKIMPEGWEKKWSVVPPALDKLGAQQAESIIMQNGAETAHHTVYRYSNPWVATFHVRFDKEVFFPSVGWDWSGLDEANSLPLHADQQQIKRGKSNDPYLGDGCTALLRYGPYISDWSSPIREGTMSIEEFKQIVLKIDDLFSSCKE